ncbi:hypothetical protein VQ056_21885 [Paenibacillus sp. JTLBN-2024]
MSGEELHNLQHKNTKRERAIEGFEAEYQDEKINKSKRGFPSLEQKKLPA